MANVDTVAPGILAQWQFDFRHVDYACSLYIWHDVCARFCNRRIRYFWIFNRVELLCAALVLTGALSLCYKQDDADSFTWKFITLSSLLLVVALVYTYALSPQMSALGLHLDLFNASFEAPVLMNSLHISYWLLEGLKLIAGGILLKLCFDSRSSSLSVS